MKNVYLAYLHILAFVGLSAHAEGLANEWFATPWNSKAKEAAGRGYLDSLPEREFTDEDIEEMERRSEEAHRQEHEMHPAIAERRYAVFEERLAANMPGGISIDQLIGEEKWNSLR